MLIARLLIKYFGKGAVIMLNFYDFEVFKEDWLVVIINLAERLETVIVNDRDKLQAYYDAHKDEIWVGYNSRRYDQYILKAILCGFNPKEINDHIIDKNKGGWSFSPLLKKIPLNDYDVFRQATDRGLKTHEGFMGNNIKETSIPFDIDRKLTAEELEETIKYCRHDVEQTAEVFFHRKEQFDARMGLIKMFNLPLSYVSKTNAQLTAIVLGATRVSRNDEFDIEFPPTMKIEKYREVVEWYKDPNNLDYTKSLEIDIAGVPHIFAWGGIHGAIPLYSGEGIYLMMDVRSYYPSLMIRYNWLSRNVKDPKKFEDIYNQRIEFKAAKDPRQEPLKGVINTTYGASKDKFNPLFDPRQANCVCVGGQLLLLDLIERLEDHCQIIQSNTDGILIKLHHIDDYELIDDIVYEWESRTGMVMEFEMYSKIYQKDVNNYLVIPYDGKLFDERGKERFKRKGMYTKKLDALDYDLPIVNKAVVDFMLYGTHPRKTVMACSELVMFQKIVKISGNYLHAIHNGQIQNEKTLRVFASKRSTDTGIFKIKANGRPEKFMLTAEHVFIDNGDVNDKVAPDYLDREWYIDLAIERLSQYGVSV